MSAVIRIASSEADREAVFRLRYDVYAEELKRTQIHVDAARCRIEEPLDQDGILFVAYDADRAVGTVRLNYVRNQQLTDYVRLYQMDRVSDFSAAGGSVTTKMIVGRSHRSHSLGYRLALAGYDHLLRDGLEHDFIDVYPARIPFVQRLGYRVHVPSVVHPEYGEVIVMRLDLRDARHLRSVGSPFAEALDRHQLAA